MTTKNDHILSQLAVKLIDSQTDNAIGSGVIYKHRNLRDYIYILTAAHCLYYDKDEFQQPLETITIQIFNSALRKYVTINQKVDYRFVSSSKEADYAVIVLQRIPLEEQTGLLPEIPAIRNRHTATSFAVKGFPIATNSEEIVSIAPTWAQELPGSSIFQLHLNQDFSSRESANYQVEGFSGSGVYIVEQDQLFFIGIFTRFLDAGKVIYCQYLAGINDLLRANFLPIIDFTFFGSNGLNVSFFTNTAEQSVKNLGPRFNEDLNFKLPIAFRFNIIAKDSSFKQQLSKVVDDYLSAPNYSSGNHELLLAAEKDYEVLNQKIQQWFNDLDWSPSKNVEFTDLVSAIDLFNSEAQEKIREFQKLQHEEIKADKGQNRSYNYNPPYQSPISRLYQMRKNNTKLRYDLSELHLELTNNPVMLIKGEAGSGKSHLLGDIVSERNKKGCPALLLLGQLFKKEQTIWQNILSLLGLQCSSREFLETLNDIGRQTGIRVLFMFDALNEGAGEILWYSGLSGFISEIKKYPYIALVMSVRTSYWRAIVPQAVGNDNSITQLTHEGFRGNEYKALQLFCKHYGIRQPNFPILAPEYTNPLLLRLICKGIKASGENAFPQGFQGITKIFGYYVKAIQENLSTKRSSYRNRPMLTKQAMEKFAAATFEEKENRYLSIEQTVELFDAEFHKFPDLLNDLIEESVLIRRMIESYNGADKDIVYFSYERFGDFFLAEDVLKKFKSKPEIIQAFQKTEPLGALIEDYYWSNNGLLEALAVLLPEMWNLEITEVYSWVFDGQNEENFRNHVGDSINRWLVQSMKWRKLDSINLDKMITWINESGHFDMDIGSWFYFVTEVTAIPNHPFNADRLDIVLRKNPMPQRDAFWQEHIGGYHGYDDDGIAFPITRLIEWAWQEGISKLTDEETSRLVGQTLCWILCTTNRGLRDQVTKALVNLLQDQIETLTELLVKFDGIDDSYIKERLYAVAYGCALRCPIVSLPLLSQKVYDLIFKGGNPPAHILLRDYARSILEYAIHQKINFIYDPLLIKPPYRSVMPEIFPSNEEIELLEKEDDKQTEEEKRQSKAASNIIHSVVNWDFGRYTVDSRFSDFSPVRFTFLSEVNQFLSVLPRGSKVRFKYLSKFFKFINTNGKKQQKMFAKPSKCREDNLLQMFNQTYEQLLKEFYTLLSTTQKEFFEKKVIPYWETELALAEDKWLHLNTRPFKNWIVKRVLELGYNGNLHNNYDRRFNDYDGRTDGRVERIGKKYQWIALYEILAIVADNYKISDGWGNGRKERYYSGPWDIMARDVDPSFTFKDRIPKYDEDEFSEDSNQNTWWSAEKYDYWYRLPSDWANSTIDLPGQINSIQKTDSVGKEWLYLNFSYTWKEPKVVGKERYGTSWKEIWYMFQAYLVPNSKADVTIQWLQKKNFHGKWLPENGVQTDLLTREHFWSPISKQWQRDHSKWQTLKDSSYKVQIASTIATGEMSEDKSGAHFYYDMPCQTIFEGMGLRYDKRDGEFINDNGELIVTNISPIGCMIRKDKLISFLDQQKLTIIWAFLGEKNAFNNNYAEDHRKSISGVYYLKDNELVGQMKIYNW